ncbi:MAG: phosphoglycerate dehydrogenase [Chloroflexi bacterium]|nr:phosphoglycerate dehydrogenase [Chloroflexota bacterium]
MRILITDGLDEAGLTLLKEHAEVEVHRNMPKAELLAALPQYDALIVRSSTQVTDEILAAGTRLRVVGRAGTGVDNIDVEAATRRGIAVVNAPTGNSNAVAEHTIALMLALARGLYGAIASLKAGRWEKSSLQGHEVKGKILGLIGLGRIGALVASKAKGLEMRVMAFDPYVTSARAASLGVELASLDEVLSQADFLSVHTPLTPQTHGLLGRKELARLKPTAYVLNCARGGIIDEEALEEALREGRIAGAGLDVFEVEPATSSRLIGLPNVIATPHVGASTAEAQQQVAIDVAQAVLDVLQGRIPATPVNLPYVPPQALGFLQPYLDLARRMGTFFFQWHGTLANRLELVYEGEVCEYDTRLLSAAFLEGLLSQTTAQPVNLVNANLIAERRGLAISEMCLPTSAVYESLITARLQNGEVNRSIAGAMIQGEPHLVTLDDQRLTCVLAGHMLVDLHLDRPGIVGRMGLILGDEGINISFVQMSRAQRGGAQIMILGLDEPVPPTLLPRFQQVPNVQRVRAISLPPLHSTE